MAGRSLGNFAQRTFSSLFGRGDYTEAIDAGGHETGVAPTSNTITNPTPFKELAAQVPEMDSDGAGDQWVRVRHREYVRDIFSPPVGSANIYVLPINPANGGSANAPFQWLGPQALLYEQWKALGICVEFVSTSGTAVGGLDTSLGTVSMASQYNTMAGPFQNKSQILNHYFSSSGASSTNVLHAIECDPAVTNPGPLYTWLSSVSPAPQEGDKRLYNHCTTTVWVDGQQAELSNIGQLWITYDLLLTKPRIPTAIQAKDIPSEVWQGAETLEEQTALINRYLERRALLHEIEEKEVDEAEERLHEMLLPPPPPPSLDRVQTKARRSAVNLLGANGYEMVAT